MTPNVYAKGIKADLATFMDTLPKNPIAPIILTTRSKNANEDYIIPMTLPGVQKLKDEVEFSETGDKKYTIPNVDYSVGVTENRNTIQDSQEYLGGMVTNRIKKAAQGFINLPTKEVTTLMESTTGTAFDGVTFWSSSRTLAGSGTLNNIAKSTGALTSVAVATADYARAKTRISGFKDKNGNPFNPAPQLAVICPPHMEDVWNQILAVRNNLSASDTLYQGTAKVIVNPYASSANTSYLVDLSQGDAFIWQERKAPEFYMNDDNKKQDVEFYWKARYGVGYGMPTSIVKMSS